MLDTLIFIFLIIALAGFILHFFPTKWKKYFGICGWVGLLAGLLCMLPEQIAEGGVFYPALIILFVPIVYITVKRLLADDEHITRLTYGVGVGALVYAPFELIKPLGDWLISVVVSCIQFVFNVTGFPYKMYDWNIFESVWLIPGYSVGYRDEIILGCTGITAIAILLGVIFLTPTSWKKKLALFCLITIPIYIVNIFRNVFVIRAYFEQWFPYMEEWFYHPTIPNYASFAWSHNIICEGLAFAVIIIIAVLLFKLAPGLVSSIKSILLIYRDDARELLRQKK
ncbi:MAG TPA: archaeosortase A [Methanocorpusculum sp.]|nr:archaeosortase A [Methanocorpusculum sp.]